MRIWGPGLDTNEYPRLPLSRGYSGKLHKINDHLLKTPYHWTGNLLDLTVVQCQHWSLYRASQEKLGEHEMKECSLNPISYFFIVPFLDFILRIFIFHSFISFSVCQSWRFLLIVGIAQFTFLSYQTTIPPWPIKMKVCLLSHYWL